MRPVIRVTEVKLRCVTSDDVKNVYELLSNWDVVRHMLFPLHTPEASEQFIQDAIGESAASPLRSIVRAMVVNGRTELVGLCGIAILRGTEEGEIWYLVNPDDWGRGLATGAVAELLEFGFAHLGLHRIWACCLPANPASARVLEKVGMRREGYRLRNLKIHGEWQDSVQFAMLAEEWETRHRRPEVSEETQVAAAAATLR